MPFQCWIAVITRCHDAMKILASREKKYTGPLKVYSTNKYQLQSERFTSPLKISPPVTFTFTNPETPPKEEEKAFATFIDDLLQQLGLVKEEPEVKIKKENLPDVFIVEGRSTPKISPPPPPCITPAKNKPEKKQTSKLVQTDIFKCEDCERRKKILYRTTGCQAEDSMITFSVSTQVTEEDFQPKMPKSQSLAAMTPAQLLAKSRESLSAISRSARMDVDNFDVATSTYANRPNYFRGPEVYGMARPNPIFPGPIYDPVMGLERGRDPNGPRMPDPALRFTHNYY